MKTKSRKMATTMTMSHRNNSIPSTMGLIILSMAQPAIVVIITQVMMMVPTHTLHPHQVEMTNLQDPMKQYKRRTQNTTQEEKSKMKPKVTEKMRMKMPKMRMGTVNRKLKTETTFQKLSNTTIYKKIECQTTPI